MTEFEEDLNRRMDSKEVPMYFTQSGCSMTRKTYIETNWVFDTYKNWRSDEHAQKLVELGGSYVLANKNLMDENEKLAQEIADLKSQFQQQALPVVPECVAIAIESTPDDYSAFEALDLIKSKVETLTEENKDWLKVYNWLCEGIENQDIFALAFITGKYEVEKPQLFYLKNKLTGAYLYYDEATKLYSDIVGNVEDFFGTKTKFTQQEIDSMQTGSYEQIEVAE